MKEQLNIDKNRGYRFGRFTLNLGERFLLCDEEPISMPPKVFDVLVFLVERHGHLVTKDELLDEVWSDSFVEEGTLVKAISRLRKILKEDSQNEFIKTVPKSGYRFTGKVTYIDSNGNLLKADENKESSVSDKNDYNYKSNSQKNEKNGSKTDKSKENSAKSFKKSHLIFIVSLCLISLLGSALIWNYSGGKSSNISSVRTIAVMPFKMIGEKEKDEALKLAMADALIIKFSNLKNITVRPTSSIYKYVGKEINAKKIGQELEVDAILNGSIQKDDERLRVTIQLISTNDGTPLWAEKFVALENDIFGIQDNISKQIVDALELELTGLEKEKLDKRFTENRDAYDAYITGRYLWSRRTPKDLERSLAFFEKAIEIDPKYALAHTGIADCYQVFAEYRLMPINDAFSKARSSARKALEIDSNLAEAHTSLAYTLAFYDWDFDEAEKYFKKAIELNPNYVTARIWYSEFFQVNGKLKKSWQQINKAKELAPQMPTVHGNTLAILYLERRFEELLTRSQQLVEKEPQFIYGPIFLYYGYEYTGKEKQAIEVYLKGVQDYYGDDPKDVDALREVYKKSGWKSFWKKRVEQMKNSPNKEKYLAWDFLFCYLRAGDNENAIKEIENSINNRDRWIISSKYDPSFDGLRSNEKFKELMNRLGTD